MLHGRLFPMEARMSHLDTETGGTAIGARRVRSSTARGLLIYGFGLVFCLSVATSVRAQPATASRETRETLNRSKEMTELTKVETPRSTPALAPAAVDTLIRPFRVHFSDEALANLRRRIKATQWPEKET